MPAMTSREGPLQIPNLINGHWVQSDSNVRYEILSPHHGQPIASVPESTNIEINRAITSAEQAFVTWRQTPIKERCQKLFNFRERALAQQSEIAAMVSLESGKTVEEALQGLLKGLEVTEFALSLQNLNFGGYMEVSRGVTCSLERHPLGVVVGVTPFNFPAMVPLWLYPIALALGNTFILKPSEKAAITSQKMGELILASGFPPGVFSIINGKTQAVEHLITDPKIKAVGFVGSTPAAQSVYQKATLSGKKALCLGGAKNHLIVVPDADPDFTVSGIVGSFTGCAGQRCMAGSVLVAVGEVNSIIDKIIEKAAELKCGQGLGALIDRTSLQKIENIISKSITQGAKLVLDGRSPQVAPEYVAGNWLGPTILDHTLPSMDCVQLEIFGPVLSIIRVNSVSEAMKLEASSPYGNATTIFTSSGAIAKYVTDHATCGMIGVNVGVPVPREPFSFGGTKNSKFGTGDITGISSLDLWSYLKKTTTKWSSHSDKNWMG